MPESEDREYEVLIECRAREVVGGERLPMAQLTLDYQRLSYANLVAINRELSKLVDRLVDLGAAKVARMEREKSREGQ